MKFINKLKHPLSPHSLLSGMKRLTNHCSFHQVYFTIDQAPNKLYKYRAITECWNPYLTGYGSDETVSVFNDIDFEAYSIVIGEITKEVIKAIRTFSETNFFVYDRERKTNLRFNAKTNSWEISEI